MGPRQIGKLFLAAGLVVLACFQAHRSIASPSHGLSLEAHARAVAPGEILCVVARGSEALASVEGTFLGAKLFFAMRSSEKGSVPADHGSGEKAAAAPAPDAQGKHQPSDGPASKANGDSEDGTVWSAWAVVPLDQKPGKAIITVSSVTAAGHPIAASLNLTVARKKFPEQRLTVDEKLVTPPPEVQERIDRETKRLAAIYAERRPLAPPTTVFSRPVEGEQTGVFGTRRIFNGKPRPPHPGLDLRAPIGTPVEAAGPGIVVLAGDLYFSGNTVIVDHGGGLFTIYAHLSAIKVQEGHSVRERELVGLSGATGRVTGPHLHWGAKLGDRPFDPMGLLAPGLFR